MRVRQSTLYNVIGAAVPLVVIFVTLPFYLRAIGEERYGILAILWTVLSYFSLFDAGLGRAAAQQIAKLDSGASRERQAVFWTGLALNLLLGAVGGVLLWVCGEALFGRLATAPAHLTEEMGASLKWVALAVPITTAGAVLGGTLQGLEKFVPMNAMRVFDQALNQLLPLGIALVFGAELQWLVMSVVGIRLLSALGSFALCARYLPLERAPRFDRGRVPQLLSYGGWVTVTSLVSPLLATLDRLVIGALAGPRAVAYYTVPYSLAYRIAVLPGSLSTALFPRFSAQADAERDVLMAQAVRAVLVVVTPVVLISLLAMKPFLSWWVGADFAEHSAAPGQIIVLGLWFNSLALIPFTRLQAQGRPDVVAKFHLLEVLPYWALLWFGVTAWGIAGAAVAWSVRVAADAVLLFAATRLKPDLWGSMIAPALMLTVAAAVTLVLESQGIVYWGIGMTLLSGTFIWSWRAAPPVVRELAERLVLLVLPLRLRKGGQS